MREDRVVNTHALAVVACMTMATSHQPVAVYVLSPTRKSDFYQKFRSLIVLAQLGSLSACLRHLNCRITLVDLTKSSGLVGFPRFCYLLMLAYGSASLFKSQSGRRLRINTWYGRLSFTRSVGTSFPILTAPAEPESANSRQQTAWRVKLPPGVELNTRESCP